MDEYVAVKATGNLPAGRARNETTHRVDPGTTYVWFPESRILSERLRIVTDGVRGDAIAEVPPTQIR